MVLSYSVEGLLSTGPTPSSLFVVASLEQIYSSMCKEKDLFNDFF